MFGVDNIKVYWMLKDDVVVLVKLVGFCVSLSLVLENLEDDWIKNVFDFDIWGKIDRFVLKLMKLIEFCKLF